MTSLHLVPQPVDPWTPRARARLKTELRRALDCTAAVWERDGIAAADDVLRQHWTRLETRFPGWLEVATEEGWLS